MSEESEDISDEVRALEEVMNAFLYYKRYGDEKANNMLKQLSKIPIRHQELIEAGYRQQVEDIKQRVDHNASILKIIVNFGLNALGDDALKARRIHQLRRPSADHASKVMSTIRQIVREWSSEGAGEREASYLPIIEEMDRLFPRETMKREDVRVLMPGCGLGRLAYDLISEGYTVQGNEFSFFMLITSCFILNACTEEHKFTLYPYLFDKNNTWDYADQIRPVTFPDKCANTGVTERLNSFSMCAGDFLEITRDSTFDVIVTAWFIDTAHNVMEYIDTIFEALEPGGIWINNGPLTWHWEGIPGEQSIELPYAEVMRLIKAKGFEVLSEKQIESRYTGNQRSMLQNQFHCAFFSVLKPNN